MAELAEAGLVDAVEIGRGGSGVVFRCLQVGLDRAVAVKVLTAGADGDRARFAREQQAMARLTGHPHIVSMLQSGQTASGLPFLVMPLCTQGSWLQQIAERGPLAPDEVVAVGAKIAGALAAAHRAGVIHRDVNPANILFTAYGEPTLTGFEFAEIGGGFQVSAEISGRVPAYIAPEANGGAAPGPCADVYSLGATLFAALTGYSAGKHSHEERQVTQVARPASEPLPQLLNQNVPAELAAIVAAAMALDPGVRSSAAELGEQLSHAQQLYRGDVGGSTRPASASTPEVYSTIRREVALPGEVVGREAEIAELRERFAASRLVTMTGVGGVGKTTLAMHAAAQLRADYPDGVWLIELAELRDGKLLDETVAAALGVHDQSGRSLRGVLTGFLGDQHALLVMDNCEHLVDEVAKFVDRLLSQCPQLHILATSRGILDLASESVLVVPPLAVPEPDRVNITDSLTGYSGVLLFLQRARAAVPDFTLNDSNSAAVARICSRVEGLPLAIELASARMRVMSAEQIADGLADRYALLTRGRRGASTRHKSLTGCIDWSYRLCTATEQHLWRAFAVFEGSFDLPAARHLCIDELPAEDVLVDLLGSMVDKSILIRTQQGANVRFRLLETLSDYAKTQISHSEQNRLRGRHAHWYHQLVTHAHTQWFGHAQLHWSEQLMHDLPNIRASMQFVLGHDPGAAMEMALAMRPVWMFHGMVGEARRWVEGGLDAMSAQPSLLRIYALVNIAMINFIQGDVSKVRAVAAEARKHLAVMHDEISDSGLDVEFTAALDVVDGCISMQSGDFEQATSCFRRAYIAASDFEVRVSSLSFMGWTYQVSGDLEQAMGCFESALEITKSHGELMYQSRTLVAVGAGHWLRGESQRAATFLIEGLRLSHLAGDLLVGADCLEALAWIANSRNGVRQAVVMMAAADALSRVTGSPLLRLPHQFACHGECDERARRELGVEEYAVAWSEGAALNFDEAAAASLDMCMQWYERSSGTVITSDSPPQLI